VATPSLLFSASARAENWPTYRRDNARSATTSERLVPAKLGLAWIWQSPSWPEPAWHGPAAYDAYHGFGGLRSMRDYDPVFHPVVADGRVCFGSTADDSVHCLDAKTGKPVWTFTTDAPVRVAPSVANGRVYFGSDDGNAYCLDAATGKRVWQFAPGRSRRRIVNNGRFIALRPVRTGVLVENRTAHFAASMLPWEGSYFCALDAATGEPRYVRRQEKSSLEGPIAAAADRFYIPQGRVPPRVIDKKTGDAIGSLSGTAGGGSFVTVTPAGTVLHGPGHKRGWIVETRVKDFRRLRTRGKGLDQIVAFGHSFELDARGLSCVDRRTGKGVWVRGFRGALALAVAADAVVVGFVDRVVALDRKTGADLWEHAVRGCAHGLAIASGALVVSTDEGRVYCFRPGGAMREKSASFEGRPLAPLDKKPVARAAGPWLQFMSPTTATVRWITNKPSPTVLDYGVGNTFRRVEDQRPKTVHAATLTSLRRNRACHYVVRVQEGGVLRSTGKYDIDTFFNYERPVEPTTMPAGLRNTKKSLEAQRIIDECGVHRGVCLILGNGDGWLAYELALKSRLRVVGVDTDTKAVVAARRLLLPTGFYGPRVTVHHVESYERLPFVGGFASMIILADASTLKGTGVVRELRRALRPGGKLVVPGVSEGGARAVADGFAVGGVKVRTGRGVHVTWTRKPRRLDAGEWSHQYGLANNAAYGGEALAGARSTDQMTVQWVGRPGPRYQPDRSGRKPGPLAVNGRLFGQGRNRIVAVDAHSGLILWSLEIPQFGRFNIPDDCGNWCADDNHLFAVVKDRCWQIDAETGDVKHMHRVRPPRKGWPTEWGYVGRLDGTLIGSAVRSGSPFLNHWGRGGWYDGRDTTKVCSQSLFAIDLVTGKPKWAYAKGVIINSTVTLAEGHAYFIESRHPKAVASGSPRGSRELWRDQFLVALNLKTGAVAWERAWRPTGPAIIYSLAHSGKHLVLMSNVGWSYHVYGFEATNGKRLWHEAFGSAGDHGAHMARPAIVDGTVFARPRIIDLSTGTVRKQPMPGGGCGTYSFSRHAGFFRAVHTTMWSFDANRSSNWERLRPGCWLSTIAACGLVLSPESSGGCSCGAWMETSIAFAPRTDVPTFATKQRRFAGSLDVVLRPALAGGDVHVTTDGSEPTAKSPRYKKPIRIAEPTTVRARAIVQGVAGPVVERRYDRIEAKPATDITVNFQRGGKAPKGCVADTGAPFGTRAGGLAYGWSQSMSGAIRHRGRNRDPKLDSQVYFMPGVTWSIAVENGAYEVTVSIGDAMYAVQRGTVFANGVKLCENVRLGPNRFHKATGTVDVKDGRLTLRSHTSASPAERTRMNYVVIRKKPLPVRRMPRVPSRR
jgi:outer membrane protein assembly factor BamB/SAM-dependent methyltransferase